MSNTNELLDRRMSSILMKIDTETVKKVIINFVDAVESAPAKEGDKSRTKATEYQAKSQHSPHYDFEQAMRGLLDHALEASEIEVTKTNKEQFTVVGLKISGDLFMNQARVEIILAKIVERSEKVMVLPPSPQVTLSDGSNYLNWKDLQKKVKLVVEEAWQYLKGKHADDDIQLSFTFDDDKVSRETAPKKKKERVPLPIVDQPLTGQAGIA